jgi:hypothetical protein
VDDKTITACDNQHIHTHHSIISITMHQKPTAALVFVSTGIVSLSLHVD